MLARTRPSATDRVSSFGADCLSVNTLWYRAPPASRLRRVDAYQAEREILLRDFGETLRELRETRFESQEALADAANLHRTHVSFLERGGREPSLSTLLILAETLGVSLDRLAQGQPAPKQRRPPPPKARRAPNRRG
jgi:ribosome-binding protein aMBF1 (putative translation factor)